MLCLLIGSLIFAALLACFIYSPFYSQMILKVLTVVNQSPVNPVAAQSQQQGKLSLTLHQKEEPGSALWIARQAYLDLMWSAIQQHRSDDLSRIYAAYQALVKQIEQEQQQLKAQRQETKVVAVPQAISVEQRLQQYQQWIEQYLQQYQDVRLPDEAILQDIAYLYDHHHATLRMRDVARIDVATSHQQQPYAIVVVGGGLTWDDEQKQIVVNKYTEQRLYKTLETLQQYDLPLVLSGVEAPYMQQWLKAHHVKNNMLLEKKSMNTCENSRFSSLLLQKKGGAPTVILITDAYHMPRTQRLFAKDGIATIPVIAPMPVALSQWQPSRKNYDHTRRANYELLASLRDRIWGSSDCREVP